MVVGLLGRHASPPFALAFSGCSSTMLPYSYTYTTHPDHTFISAEIQHIASPPTALALSDCSSITLPRSFAHNKRNYIHNV